MVLVSHFKALGNILPLKFLTARGVESVLFDKLSGKVDFNWSDTSLSVEADNMIHVTIGKTNDNGNLVELMAMTAVTYGNCLFCPPFFSMYQDFSGYGGRWPPNPWRR